jgi:hypothetical protein
MAEKRWVVRFDTLQGITGSGVRREVASQEIRTSATGEFAGRLVAPFSFGHSNWRARAGNHVRRERLDTGQQSRSSG